MGAGVSAGAETITVVEIKSKFGVLYDDAAAEAFAAHATKDASTEKTNAHTPGEECVRSETSTSDALFFFVVVVL